jgi:uncharacterized membrane protein
MGRILDKLPAPVASWLRTRFGKHLSRFAGVALVSLLTTQVVLSVAYLIIGTGGLATAIGWLAGAAVSYVLSRRAWERKGRPNLLKETLPFWIISGVTGIVLITAGHLAGEFAKGHHLARLDATAVVSGTVLLANVLTFITRFVIFHYVLFADPRAKAAEFGAPTAETVEGEPADARAGLAAAPERSADQRAHSSRPGSR